MPKKAKAGLTLRTRLIATYLIVLMVPGIIIGMLTYRTASSAVTDQLINNAQESITAVNEIINSNIQSKINDVNYFVDAVSSATANSKTDGEGYAELKDRLQEYAAMHPDVLEAYVATNEGKVIKASDTPLPSGYDPRSEDAYVSAVKKGKGVVISPVFNNANKETVVSLSSVLKDGNGVFVIQLNLKQLAGLVDLKVGKKGYILIMDSGKRFVVHPTEPLGQVSSRDFVNRMFEKGSGTFEYTFNGEEKSLTYMVNKLTGWRIAGTINTSEITGASDGIRTTALIVIFVSVLIGMVPIFFIIRSLLLPLSRLSKATEVISKGDLSQDIGSFGRDEIGQLASNFKTMVASLREMIFGVQEMTDNVSSSAAELTAGAEQTTKAIEHVTIAIQEVAYGNEQQVKSINKGMEGSVATTAEVKSISANMDEVSVMMDKATRSAAEGNDSVIQVVDKINSIHETVEELGAVIDKLNERSGRIVGIVGIISGIARQTNLLALNASIEAARAGEHGRGFAVVATEVRKLAEESEKSASQISGVISSIHSEVKAAIETMNNAKEKVSEGIMAVDTTGRSFSRIRRAVKGAAEKIEAMCEGGRTLSQEADGMEQAMEVIRIISQETSANTETISAAAQQQLASVEEIASSSSDLSRLADELQDLVSRFKLYDTATADKLSDELAEAGNTAEEEESPNGIAS
ncbi:methyl-accepting chemotaxis sensory transducer with TarH sensor [Paenibacillus sophorae]|uniref:Methyl-accepting chemotaxis protein n=1 Tax=Paenibacillus sophorae TaxID=1333845 RepID=A0A1H8IF00_9BACL|nr:methyl-accepting chemotaxis protein [Paenibacillus sophorae]QWU15953.1 methyl-accepting chemotaxis protein [Paenibacillus sophorae]SEN67430.1 methyl-accepting chemotaxis sensory transducer with TarH sensor [Paenibacillus sophorae]